MDHTFQGAPGNSGRVRFRVMLSTQRCGAQITPKLNPLHYYYELVLSRVYGNLCQIFYQTLSPLFELNFRFVSTVWHRCNTRTIGTSQRQGQLATVRDQPEGHR